MSGGAARPYAVMLDVAGKLAVVIGGAAGAIRTARTLSAHGADVVVIASDIPRDLLASEAVGELTVEFRDYAHGDLEGAFIAVAASGSSEIDAAVAKEAHQRGVLVNVPGDAGASDFVIPSVVRRGPLQIAVTTGGGAPSVALEVRRGIAEAYGPEWDAYTALVTELRVLAIERTGLTDAALAPLFAAVASSGVRARLRSGDTITAKDLFEEHAATVTDPVETGGTG